jgi:hypothetical protein
MAIHIRVSDQSYKRKGLGKPDRPEGEAMTLPHVLIAAGAGIVLFGIVGLIVHRSKDWRL